MKRQRTRRAFTKVEPEKQLLEWERGAIVIALACMFFLWLTWGGLMSTWWRIQSLRPVDGQVVKVEVVSRRLNKFRYWFVVPTFTYSAGGVSHTGTLLYPGRNELSQDEAQIIASNIHPGPCQVFVSSDDANFAVLRAELNGKDWWDAVMIGGFMFLVLVLSVWSWWHYRSKRLRLHASAGGST